MKSTIAKYTALAVSCFQSLQVNRETLERKRLAVTMRGLALKEISVSANGKRLSLKRCGSDFLNGIAVALTTAVGVYFWSHSSGPWLWS